MKSVSVVAGALAAILSLALVLIAALREFGFTVWLSDFIVALRVDPERVFARVAYVFVIIILVVGVAVWLNRISVTLRNNRTGRWRARIVCTMTAGFVLAPLMGSLAVVFVILPEKLGHAEADCLFPQLGDRGGIVIRTYAANGEVVYDVIDLPETGGPDCYARIFMHAYKDQIDYQAGWVMFFVYGLDLGKYKDLTFEVRGEKGGESIGIKAKDARGVENGLEIDEKYVAGGITNRWKEVRIPLSNFGNVDFGLMDNISLFTNGAIAGTIPQTIRVGHFRMR